MTGMDAADRIPLLERELLRIQNELTEARRTVALGAPSEDAIRGIRQAAAWCDESGDMYIEHAAWFILQKLEELLARVR